MMNEFLGVKATHLVPFGFELLIKQVVLND